MEPLSEGLWIVKFERYCQIMLYRDSTVYKLINSSFLQTLSSGLNTLSPDKTQNLTVIVIGVSSTVRALDLVLCSQSLMFSINCFCKLFVFINCLPSSLLVSLKCWGFFFFALVDLWVCCILRKLALCVHIINNLSRFVRILILFFPPVLGSKDIVQGFCLWCSHLMIVQFSSN